jgi:transposase-like protein
MVMEEIMREELTQFLGAEWGECCVERKGYRNGSYTRDLATTSGETRRSPGPERSRRRVSHADL